MINTRSATGAKRHTDEQMLGQDLQLQKYLMVGRGCDRGARVALGK